MPTPVRLPETHRLDQILPAGREGGLEFARIVDLLLFHEARRQGRPCSATVRATIRGSTASLMGGCASTAGWAISISFIRRRSAASTARKSRPLLSKPKTRDKAKSSAVD